MPAIGVVDRVGVPHEVGEGVCEGCQTESVQESACAAGGRVEALERMAAEEGGGGAAGGGGRGHGGGGGS